MTNRRTHVVPLGDTLDHTPSPDCWCQPVRDTENPALYVHHAKDCREAQERAGRVNPDKPWKVVEE